MDENVNEFLLNVTFELPLILTLAIGLTICWTQRRQKPRTSKMLGIAIGAELVLALGGWQGYYLAIRSLGLYPEFSPDDVNHVSWMLQTALVSIPPSLVHAVIWGLALWAVLMIDDSDAAERSLLSEQPDKPLVTGS